MRWCMVGIAAAGGCVIRRLRMPVLGMTVGRVVSGIRISVGIRVHVGFRESSCIEIPHRDDGFDGWALIGLTLVIGLRLVVDDRIGDDIVLAGFFKQLDLTAFLTRCLGDDIDMHVIVGGF